MIQTKHDLLEALKELEERSQNVINKYVPTNLPEHDQLAFHSSNKTYRLMTGGNQSGKSYGAAAEISWWARNRHPYREVPDGDIEIWVISAEYVTIKTGIYRHLKNLIPEHDIVNTGPRVQGHNLPSYIDVRRKGGGKCTITFMSSKGEQREKFQAAAVHLIAIDEEVPEDIWEELEARTLVSGGQFIISATLVESYEWVLKLEQLGEAEHEDVFLTRLVTTENPYVHQATLRRLMGKWSDETKEYRIYGKSRRSVGLVYNTFTEDHICKPFTIPIDWPRWCAVDPGIRTTAVLWVAVGPRNKAYAYRELYLQNEALYEVVKAIKVSEGWVLNQELSVEFGHFVWEEPSLRSDDDRQPEQIISRCIDPSAIRRSEAGAPSIIDQMQSMYGIHCMEADNSKQSGIETIRFWLEQTIDDKPLFQVFSTLENFLEERRAYRLRSGRVKKDRNDPIDEPVKSRDHLMDCWRYIAMQRPRWEDRWILDNEPQKQRRTVSDMLKRKKRKHNDYEHEFLGSEW